MAKPNIIARYKYTDSEQFINIRQKGKEKLQTPLSGKTWP